MPRKHTFVWCVACESRPHLRHHEDRGFFVSCDCQSQRGVSIVGDLTHDAPRMWEYGASGTVREGQTDA